jgi:hypothetical protein
MRRAADHHAGVNPETVRRRVGGAVHMVSTNVDRMGQPFVSTLESKAYPFYGSQWHPEKNGFEWTVNEAIPHSSNAVAAMQCKQQHPSLFSEQSHKYYMYVFYTTSMCVRGGRGGYRVVREAV